MSSATQLAIVNGLNVPDLKVWAICEIATYDVWGNARDGYEVNNTFRQSEPIKIPCEATISNVPRMPGASDAYRSFPDSGSFNTEVMISFHPSDKAIKAALGITCRIATDGDDKMITVERERDGYPLGELYVIGYSDTDD